jgi:hypothetical protein
MKRDSNNATILLLTDDAYLQHLTLERKDQVMFDLFWLGFIAYSFGYSISQTTLVSFIVCQLFQSLGLISMIVAAFSQIRYKFEHPYLQVIFSLYLLWLLSIMLRGMVFDYNSIKVLLFDAYFGALLYFTPLVLLFPRNLFFYKRLFDVLFIFGIAFCGLTLVFAKVIVVADREDLVSRGIVEVFNRNLGIPTIFLLLTFLYHTPKRKILALGIALVVMLLALIKARRGLLLMTIIPLLIAYMFYLIESKSKILIILVSVVFGCAMVIYGMSIYEKSSLFSYMKDRGMEDTRTNVEVAFRRDLDTKDWLIGRGMLGEYYCPGIDENKTGYRSVIETDYLQTILKGGIISLGLLLLVIVPAMFLCLFASKNLLSKAAGAWIFWSILNMYPSNINTFSLNYLIMWISVGIGYSKAIRELPEEVLRLYFNPN